MKSIKELEEIRNNTWPRVEQGKNRKNPRIVIGMATCGIAAGATAVMDAIIDELKVLNINDIEVVQTGCIGVCKLEPIVEVIMPGEEKVTYVKMTATMARSVVREHILKGKVIDEYTMFVVKGKVLNDYTILNG